ncbi:putative pectinesterase/pectinesterase inhibitor 45 [Apium graveolens]|uniref:putative pectinesterase/pectinesterase inhibitor 45 n=1 Tax=Apium graveolens TaxID=4045 RepID=UPI003D7910E8
MKLDIYVATMAFQDFDLLNERREIEKKRRQKRIMICAIVLCILVIGAAVALLVFQKKDDVDSVDSKPGEKSSNEKSKKSKDNKPAHKKHQDKDNADVSKSSKMVKTMCASTDFKATCESNLGKFVKANPSVTQQPKDLIKAAFSVVSDELEKTMNDSSKFKLDTPKKKEAFEVCKKVIGDALQELNSSTNTVGEKDIGALDSKKGNLNNWLSAVMSYQQTCIDAIPEGEAKEEIKKALQTSTELTSNSLAIVSQMSTILSSFPKPKRLLLSESRQRTLLEEKFPVWMHIADRKLLKIDPPKQKPDVTVAKDGSGDFKTINDALAKLPQNHQGRYVILIKEGVYEENVLLTKKMVNITMLGDGSQKTIITGSKNNVDGVPTFKTATFAAEGDGFMAQNIGFRNTAGPEKHQAVALRVQSDRSIFLNCRMEGYQDTLYVQAHRQFYRGCYITGTVDFIFGDAAAILQNCLIYVRKPMDGQKNTVTAQGRSDKRETTGLVLHNCKILADDQMSPVKEKFKSYLGRPWKEFSRTIVMETEIDDIIDPQGWLPWEGNFALSTLFYAEYNNKGPGSDVKDRVKWPGFKVIKKDEAVKYTVGPFLQGDSWLKGDVGAPVHFDLFN